MDQFKTRFVILRHELPGDADRPSHWDLMIEQAGQLLTWAIEELPFSVESHLSTGSGGSIDSSQTVTAFRLADHRIAYLTYEGDVSGGRGTVKRLDEGEAIVFEQSDFALAAELHGAKIKLGVEIEGEPKIGSEADQGQRCSVTFSSLADFLERRRASP